MATLNIENKIVAFGDVTITNNPRLRYVDWYRNVQGITIGTPRTESFIINAGETVSVAGTSLAGSPPTVTITSYDASGLRTKLFGSFGSVTATVSDLVSITVKPSGYVDFEVPSALTIAGVTTGNIFYVKGFSTYDGAGNPINQINEGLWKVIKRTGAIMTCQKLDGGTGAVSQATVGNLINAYGDYSLVVSSSLTASQGNYLALTNPGNPFAYGNLYKVLYADALRIDIESVNYDINLPATGYVATDRFYFGYVETDGETVVTYQVGGTDFIVPVIPMRVSADQMIGWFQITSDFNYLSVNNNGSNPINVTVVVGG